RVAGVSPQKAGYLQDLTRQVLAGTVNLHQIGRLSDERVISSLVRVRGIGRWTAQMFLMFALARPNIFPIDDLGIRRAIERLYGLTPDCDRQLYHDISQRWVPYCTVACWYCWRSGEEPPDATGSATTTAGGN
ncbi:MAG: DNA-3-methyladenine glycosylase 2 family protein, partial [Planctomycetaceae bacterium]